MKIILIDNEAIQLSSLQKLIERIMPSSTIFIATKFDKAFEIIKKNNKDCILFCNKDLPSLNGIKLIEKIQSEKLVTNYHYVLTYNSLTQSHKKIAVKCGVDRFLPKPFQIEDLLPILKNGDQLISSLNNAEKAINNFQDLKESFDNEVLKIKEIIDMILEARIPGIIEKSISIEKAAEWIAKKHGVTDQIELNNLKIAAKLQFTGRLALDDKFIQQPVMIDGRLSDPVLKQIPEFGEEITSKIKGYDQVKEIIRYVYENYDGTGFPSGKKAAEIPKLSRVLRVATDFYESVYSGNKEEDSVELIVKDARRLYDHIPAAFIDQYLANFGSENRRAEVPHTIKDISEGMTLSRNIITSEGLILLGKDTNLNEDNIAKLRSTASTEGIIGDIYVYDLASHEERTESEEQ